MRASSVARRPMTWATVRDWDWWQLPVTLRAYLGVVDVVAVALIGLAASQTAWRVTDLAKFLLLVGCGLISIAATPRIAYGQGAMVRDFLTVWVLPVAILLPPFYAMVAPIPLLMLTQWRVHRGVVYRRVFSSAAIGLAYGAASLLFHAIPASFAGGVLGGGMHALTWTAAVAGCEVVGWVGHHMFLVSAVRMSDPTVRVAGLVLDRETLQADFAQVDLGVLTTVVVGINPVLAVIGVPTVLLARRFMMHAQLLAKSRIDSKTGLLNAGTWESEAAAEISRTMRTQSPLSMALIDIDHFKVVNDTYGHLVGDMALRALGAALREELRDYDVAGRFGGEEFVVLLPQTDEADAVSIAERLRMHIAGMSIPIDDDARPGTAVRITVSVGVAALDPAGGELTDLLAAADAALYYAKQTGRNKVHVATSDIPLRQVVPTARQAPAALDVPGSSLRLPAVPGAGPEAFSAAAVCRPVARDRQAAAARTRRPCPSRCAARPSAGKAA
jgi:diguanylate cyclase (GGDEF)-like protein